ncbi:hypothetical protein F3Y22_tig00111392pilonHSYRG00599 [Hibiscus syriacus]|uniref:CCT domain-containing protein n=1 Tax=Hibiscus syriacus TaxID=106335 RepID=A0A6A2YLU3_HIBSY|nr:zinc finger protein CONSTANS-LIKE 3-like [Hibiscus syriacus]KAE8680298.1 hypothetical protein F3Y22_tig00111392pilonHSYRG00599 [Hibiscus syriacus]
MASVPEFSDDYSFSDDFSQFQNPLLIPQENCIDDIGGAIPSSATCGEEISFLMFLDNGGVGVFQQEHSNLSPSVPTAVFPDNNIAAGCGIDGRYQLQDVCDEFGEECNRILHQDFKPVNMGDNWEVQDNRMVPAVQDNNHKAVRYSVEERKDRILRYVKKRNQRNFNKTIKYACRKALADRRVRVRGRFARNNTELHEDEIEMREEDNNTSPIEKHLNYCDSVQIKHDELDEWLQQAMANLIYLPHMAG